MRFPLISRRLHEAQIHAMIACINSLKSTISTCSDLILEKSRQIEVLEGLLDSKKCNDYTSGGLKAVNKPAHIFYGRGAYRTRAEMASEATIVQTGDSIRELEQKVEKERINNAI